MILQAFGHELVIELRRTSPFRADHLEKILPLVAMAISQIVARRDPSPSVTKTSFRDLHDISEAVLDLNEQILDLNERLEKAVAAQQRSVSERVEGDEGDEPEAAPDAPDPVAEAPSP